MAPKGSRGGSKKAIGRGVVPKVSVEASTKVQADRVPKRKPLQRVRVAAYVAENFKAVPADSKAPASEASPQALAKPSLTLEAGTSVANDFSDPRVERIISRKLLHVYGKQIIDCARDSSGASMRQWTLARINVKKGVNQNRTSIDWLDFERDFKLGNAGLEATLPEVDDVDGVSLLILEKLGAAHDKNPVARTTEPLMRYLEFLDDDLNYAEINGITLASLKSPMITHLAQSNMLGALLTYVVRRMDQL
jgi:hypothetical protein